MSNLNINNKKESNTYSSSFSKLKTFGDVASFLGVNSDYLKFWLYQNKKRYTTFQLTKRNGAYRTIHAPCDGLKYIQKQLLEKLTLEYSFEKSKAIHGFINKRNIKTNAEMHFLKGKPPNYILNIDIENFFPTIHFGRIKAMFMSLFKCTDLVGKFLAQITVCNTEDGPGRLPQGAPTSPIISNIICYKLDKMLIKLIQSSKYKIMYSRYADDITFSSKNKMNTLCFRNGNKIELTTELIDVFERNGFRINKDKIRLQAKNERQEITGLIVNEKINLSKKFIRQVRAMLYTWQADGRDKAASKYFEKYSQKNYKDKPKYEHIVRGKLEYMRMILGSDNLIFRKYFNQYCTLMDMEDAQYPMNKQELLSESVRNIEVEGKQAGRVGTCFFISEIGWITCYHLIQGLDLDSINIKIQKKKEYRMSELVQVDIKKRLELYDLLILEHSDEIVKPRKNFQLSIEFYFDFIAGAKIQCIGFPEKQGPQNITIIEATVVELERVVDCSGYRIDSYRIDSDIYHGNSGGPVLSNGNNEFEKDVIGIVAFGKEDENSNFMSGFIPFTKDNKNFLK